MTLVTKPFEALTNRIAENVGFVDLKRVIMPYHPLKSFTPGLVADIARRAFPDIVRALTDRSSKNLAYVSLE